MVWATPSTVTMPAALSLTMSVTLMPCATIKFH